MATLRDVAEMAGVSITTASFVMNGKGRRMGLGKSTSERVLRCARELGYEGNYHARSLRHGRSSTIGLAMSTSLQHRMWGTVAAGVDEAARGAGNDLLIVGQDGDEHAAVKGLGYLREKRIDALVCTGGTAYQLRDAPADADIVVVQGRDIGFPTVNLDPAPGMRAAAEHLAALGHTRVAYFGKKAGGRVQLEERLDVFRTACTERGMELATVMLSSEESYHEEIEWHLHHCYDLIGGLTALPAATAMMCYNDTMALALCAVLRDRGLRVPTDVSVVGFDDLHAAQGLPGLTTVSHMLRELGARAVKLALSFVEAEDPATRHDTVAAELIVRESTAPPPESARS